jgi:shikimate dehydrogenase
MTDRYAVFGNPIAHSKSPQIHTLFASQCDQTMVYEARLVGIDVFTAETADFFNAGGKGLNITVPFKLAAYDFADELTAQAQRAGAVNTLIWQDNGSILGATTDGVGLVRDIAVNQQWVLQGKRILVLGAGGAVRGVLEPLLKQQPQRVIVANRTVSKAEQLAEDFCQFGVISGCGFDQLQNQQFDVVINGTSASLAGDLPPLPTSLLAGGACCYDMMYAAEPTVFLRWCAQQGAAKIADGLGMLVEQAAESFCLWRGIRPDTQSVITAMRQQLQRLN